MAKSPLYSPVLDRDGTSQSARRPAALDPSFALVDERSLADLLDFAIAYGEELVYHDETNSPQGGFGALVDPVMVPSLIELIEAPPSIVQDRVLRACRPHVALLLAFLKLLRHGQDHLNTLTQRHLDFYYRSVLGMTTRAPVPDRVNVLVKLGGVDQALLPAGSLLDGGKDSRGKDLAYRTDRDAVLSRAEVAALRTVRVERTVTTIESAVAAHANDKDAGLLAALTIALGDPEPGDPLPRYKGTKAVDVALLRDLYRLVTFAGSHLFMELDELDELLKLSQRRAQTAAEWRKINGILELAGRKKRNDPTYRLAPKDLTAFDVNFEAAVGPVQYTGLGVSNLSAYQAEVARVKDAFHMPVEDFAYIMDAFEPSATAPKDRGRACELLARAHARKVEHDRRRELKLLGQSKANSLDGLRAVLGRALGREGTQESMRELIERLREFTNDSADIAFLHSMARAAMPPSVLPAAGWDRILEIVERAQRVREGSVTTVAEKIEWLDIHAYEDATQVISNLGIEADRGAPRWKAFGAVAPRTDPQNAPSPVLGWAVSSPLLCLTEGKRVITVTLGFEPAGFDNTRIATALATFPFVIELSTEKGLTRAAAVTAEKGDYKTLSGTARVIPGPLPAIKLTIALDEDVDPVTALPMRSDAGGASRAPVLRVLLRPFWDAVLGRFTTPYAPFRSLVLVAAHVHVDVRGVTSLALANDRSRLDPKQPVEPFGSRPSVGSRFYVGHPELAQKRLASLRLHVEWMQVPSSLAAHYAAYGISANFKARIALHDRRREVDLLAQAPLFAAPDASAAQRIEIPDVPAALRGASPAYAYAQAKEAGTSEDPVTAWDRYLVWELTPLDFQHHVYAPLVAAKAGQMALDIAKQATGSNTAASYHVNPPYTPTLKRLTVDYTASIEVLPSAPATEDRLYHVHPFGDRQVASPPGQGAPLLPRYDDYEGELYLGLRDVASPGSLSLLFQLAEGSADPDAAPSAVEWSYLSGDRWLSLHSGNIVSDGTGGLLRTGILELSLDEADPNASMPPDLYWLRAAVRRGATGVPDVIGVHTQAVPATFADRGNAPDHCDAPLPAGSIKKLLEPVRGIAAVAQPYPSFGGSGAERDADFHARVSERLRHKQRALSIWDYERLVLLRFPEIYKAKCLPVEQNQRPDQPDKVAVIVIPNIKDQIPFDPFEPKAKAATLAEIEAYLSDKMPPHAGIEARNAVFIPIKVRIEVRFMRDVDEGFYKKKLNDDICRFLSPWAYDGGADIPIGDRIYANSIVDFVDRQPYVDFVAGITLFSLEGERETEIQRPPDGGYFASTDRPDGTDRPDAVLVAARQHEIDTSWEYLEELRREAEAEAAAEAAAKKRGISHMTVGLDFIIGKEPAALFGVGAMGIGIDFTIR